MELKGVGVLFLFVCMAFAQDMIASPEDTQGRELREFNQDWKAVDYLPASQDASGWIPHSEPDQPKRRRIRKRKRRPPVIERDELPRRKTRPQRLDQIKEPWEEMSEEITQKSNNRRRLTPVYDEAQERIRDPFTGLKEAEQKQRAAVDESATKPPDLKQLLKLSGGLSLSEVLQQQNLTLAELLQGNQQAISALAKETEATTETLTSTEGIKYRRLPPSVALRKDVRIRNEEANDGLTSHEVVEAQRKRTQVLHSHKKNSDIEDFPAQVEDNKVTIEPKDTTTTSSTTLSIVPKSRTRKLPMTSAKLNKLHPQNTPEPISIKVNEIVGFNVDKKNETDGPFKMIIDLGEMLTETTTIKTDVKAKAHDEILEILQDPLEKEQLSRILRMRNMTVDELVEQRERGSSQLHLADIFHNKTREPEPKDEIVGHIQPETFDSFPFSSRKGKTITIVPESTTARKEKEPVTKVPYTITSFPTYKIETVKDSSMQPFLPIWQQLYPHFFPDINQKYNPSTTSTTHKNYLDDAIDLEEVENDLAPNRLESDEPKPVEDDDEGFFSLPSGVKSAILASLAIVGLSILVFLTILLVFKWSQKQKRLNYNSSFSGSKIRSPILEPSQRRTFRTFVCETLGKKQNYYKQHLQNMSDTIWDTDEKKNYMI